MHIEFYRSKGREYGRLRDTVRKGGAVTHGKSVSLGRVLDKSRLIFKNREHGVYQYVAETGERRPLPDDFGLEAQERLIVDFGDVYVLDKFIRNGALRPVFEALECGTPDFFRALLCFYVLESAPNALADIWREGSYAGMVYPGADMDLPRILDFLRILGSETVRRRFFAAWGDFLKTQRPDGCREIILVDSTWLANDRRMPVTALCTHEGDIEEEVRLVCAVQKGTGMPVFVKHVPGRIAGVPALTGALDELRTMGAEAELVLLEADWLMPETVETLLAAGVPFLLRARRDWALFKDLLSEHLESLEAEENLQTFKGCSVCLKQVPHRLAGGGTVYGCLGMPAEGDEPGRSAGAFVLLSSQRMDLREILSLCGIREEVTRVFSLSERFADLFTWDLQDVDAFSGHLLMKFCRAAVLQLLGQRLASSECDVWNFFGCLRNQKAKVYDGIVIPAEPTREQKALYRLAGVVPETSIVLKDPFKAS